MNREYNKATQDGPDMTLQQAANAVTNNPMDAAMVIRDKVSAYWACLGSGRVNAARVLAAWHNWSKIRP